jgi:stage II sporulation protein D
MYRRTLVLLLLLASGTAVAQEKMSREDTAAILFTNRFSFTDDGEPVLPVGIMDRQETIEISVREGLVVQASGPGGPETIVPGRGRWKVQVDNAKPAVLGYRAVLEAVPTTDFEGVRKAAARWRALGVETVRIELGTLFSFQGTVFDSRETLLCADALFPEKEGARGFLSRLPSPGAPEGRVAEVLDQRPEGTVILTERSSGVTIRARNAIWFHPVEDSLTVHDVEYARGFSWHGRQTRTYGGSFYVAVDKHGMLAIANVLPAEQLLRGLVPAEIYPDAPDAALEAQAISARNELFSKIGHRHLADPYLICSEQDCQVYKGQGAEKKRASQAVERTRGRVIFDENGKLADIRYHSTCGGHTEDGHEAWAGINSPNLKGRWDVKNGKREPVTEAEVARFIADPPKTWCGRSAKARSTFRWTRKFSADELDKLVAKKYAVGSVSAIDVLHRGASGRVNKLRIVGRRGEKTVHGELVIRRLFGGLKSSLFVVEPTPDAGGAVASWEFRGGGFGHGVGMCQIGAMEMASDGKSAQEILDFYYKGITVSRIY